VSAFQHGDQVHLKLGHAHKEEEEEGEEEEKKKKGKSSGEKSSARHQIKSNEIHFKRKYKIERKN